MSTNKTYKVSVENQKTEQVFPTLKEARLAADKKVLEYPGQWVALSSVKNR